MDFQEFFISKIKMIVSLLWEMLQKTAKKHSYPHFLEKSKIRSLKSIFVLFLTKFSKIFRAGLKSIKINLKIDF